MNLLRACLLICSIGLLAGGCGDSDSKQVVVGFAQIGAESAWRTAHTESIKSTAEERGVTLKFADGQGKQENQIKALRSFVAQDVDVILLSPIVEPGWAPVLSEAKAAGIPVVLLDRRIDVDDKSLYATFIGPDSVEEGRKAGRWLAAKMDGKARIAELRGTLGAAAAKDRKQGFAEVISKHADMEIIVSQSGMFRRSKGKEVMEAFLKSHPDSIDAVFAHNDDMAIGAIQAIEDAGKKPGEDIIVISIDGVRAAFEAMIEGQLNCTVECPPLYGPYAFDAVEKLLRGEELPDEIPLEGGVFDQSTAAEDIKTRKY